MRRGRQTFLADQQAAAVDDAQTAFAAKAAQIGVLAVGPVLIATVICGTCYLETKPA